jgi:hypothetical protein
MFNYLRHPSFFGGALANLLLPFSGLFMPFGLQLFVGLVLWPGVTVLAWRLTFEDWSFKGGVIACVWALGLSWASFAIYDAARLSADGVEFARELMSQIVALPYGFASFTVAVAVGTWGIAGLLGWPRSVEAQVDSSRNPARSLLAYVIAAWLVLNALTAATNYRSVMSSQAASVAATRILLPFSMIGTATLMYVVVGLIAWPVFCVVASSRAARLREFGTSVVGVVVAAMLTYISTVAVLTQIDVVEGAALGSSLVMETMSISNTVVVVVVGLVFAGAWVAIARHGSSRRRVTSLDE